MVSILSLLVWLLCSVRTNGFIETLVPATAVTLSNGLPNTIQSNTAFVRRPTFATTAMNMMPMPVWPYIGCTGYCGGGPLGLFLALALCGAGLPLSEDVLLIGLAPRIFVGAPSMPLRSKLLYVLAAVGGTAAADTLTVGIGRALRVNAGMLGEQAPGFLQRMLFAIRKQLVVESKRDNARLTEQIETRLRAATINLGEQLRALVGIDDSENEDVTNNKDASTLTKIVASRRRFQSSSQTHKINKKRSAAASLPWVSPVSTTDSRFAGIDNRLALGQRWPLALLSGFSADPQLDYGQYFMGAALAAGTVTLPVQLVLGAALQDWSRILCYVVIAIAQLCRYGPIWATVFVAIADTVKIEIKAAKKKKK
mmetsp:Transcript_50102/g.55905  ORF Transcript_50102/g.55905 Transcript_50102/m.55905 type:complete len:368 (+) Transcript_50102:200-1303(+)